nr:TonB-dependent receptor plug domain-containing protein [Gemmatimonadales bacterium]
LALTGTVRDTLRERPVVGAEVMVNDSVVAETDAAGAYSATEIPVDWGMNTVLVRCVGYVPLLHVLWVEESSTRRSIHGVMQHQAVELPAVVVEADRIVLFYGRMREFWRRRKMGLGWFLTRDEIERRNPMFVTDLLRTIPGVSVRRTGFTTRVRFRRFGRACPPGIWIDGIRQASSDLDWLVLPQEVEAIEVYRRSAETPMEFSGTSRTCGAIVIWTR